MSLLAPSILLGRDLLAMRLDEFGQVLTLGSFNQAIALATPVNRIVRV